MTSVAAPLDAARLMALLAENAFVRRVVVLGETGSTNDDARRLAALGAPEGTVVVAETQTAGRGRLGRSWHSPPGKGVYLSVVVRPREPVELVGRYALIAAVACCEACRALSGDRVRLKWPNDVLVDGRKIAGILAETRNAGAGVELVLGIGINAGYRRGDFPAELEATAGSLPAPGGGATLDRELLARDLVATLARAITSLRSGGWEDLAERFLRYAPDASGQRVRLQDGRSGVTRGLHPSGALRVETTGGIVVVHTGVSIAAVEG